MGVGVQSLLGMAGALGQLPGEAGPGGLKPGTGLREPEQVWRHGWATLGWGASSALIFGAGTPSEVQSQDLWARPHLCCWGSRRRCLCSDHPCAGTPGQGEQRCDLGNRPRPSRSSPERLVQGHACPPAGPWGSDSSAPHLEASLAFQDFLLLLGLASLSFSFS